jgi:hypothetical protein
VENLLVGEGRSAQCIVVRFVAASKYLSMPHSKAVVLEGHA